MLYEITISEMWKELKELIKDLYLKISCFICCKSNCEIEIGNKDTNNEDNKNE